MCSLFPSEMKSCLFLTFPFMLNFYNADNYLFILPNHLIFPSVTNHNNGSFWTCLSKDSQNVPQVRTLCSLLLDMTACLICALLKIVLQSTDLNALSLWSFHHCWANRHPNQYSKEGDVESTALKKRQKTVEEWEMEQFSLKLRKWYSGQLLRLYSDQIWHSDCLSTLTDLKW